MNTLRELMRSSSQTSAEFRTALEMSLYAPLELALGRPSKKVRSELFAVLMEDCVERLKPGVYAKVCELLECLHTASIVIDDIEDETLERRGAPALHVQYGIPVALNAASWLLLSPFALLRTMQLSAKCEIEVMRAITDTLLQAHEGQAVDIATDVSVVAQDALPSLWRTTAELKTGALMALAAKLPWLCVEDHGRSETSLANFGSSFGLGLQMLDDVSDFFSKTLTDDLIKRRLNFAMVVASSELSSAEYSHLCGLLQNIKTHHEKFSQFIEEHGLREKAIAEATRHIDTSLGELTVFGEFDLARRNKLEMLKEKLIHAFTN